MTISTMPIAASQRVRAALQTNIRTRGVTGAREFNFYNVAYDDDEPFAEDRLLGGGGANLTDPTSPGPGLRNVTFTMTVPVDTSQFSYWLSACLGGKATTGTTPNLTHAMASGVRGIYSMTMEIERNTGLFDVIEGVVVQSITMNLSGSAEGWQTADIQCVGRRTDEGLSASIFTTPTLVPIGNRIAGTEGLITIDSVAFGSALDGTFTITNTFSPDRYMDGSNLVSEMVLTDFAAALSLNARLTTDVATRALGRPVAPARISPTRPIVLTLGETVARRIVFTMPTARIARPKTVASGPGGLTVALAARAEKAAVTPALQVSALNAVLGPDLW
jgi:hypothetical protein